MAIFDLIRTKILGNPVRIAPDASLYSIFTAALFDSLAFQIYLGIFALLIVCWVVIFILRKSSDNSRRLLYTTGAFIVFSALAAKYNSNINRDLKSRTDSHTLLVKKSFPNSTGDLYHSVLQLFQSLKASGGNKASMLQPTKVHNIANLESTQKPQSSNDDDTQEMESTNNEPNASKSSAVQSGSLLHKNIDAIAEPSQEESQVEVLTVQDEPGCTGKELHCLSEQVQGKTITSESLSRVKEEFEENTREAEYLNSLANKFTNTEKNISDFKATFSIFYKIAMSIKNEMASFNAYPEYYKYEAQDMVTYAENVLKITSASKFITYSKKIQQQGRRPVVEAVASQPYSESKLIFYSHAYFCICVVSGLIIAACLLCKIKYTAIIKNILNVMLLIDAVLSLVYMVYAQKMHRGCILGFTGECDDHSETDFLNIVSQSNIDLGNTADIQATNILEKIEANARSTANALKTYLSSRDSELFQMKAVSLLNFFDKINFVYDDFDNLTHNKVDKNEFYSLINKMNGNIRNIQKTIAEIKRDKLMDFYSREIAFSQIIESEKMRARGPFSVRDGDVSQKLHLQQESCQAARANICHISVISDKIWCMLGMFSLITLFINVY
ncbi:hypothetical protein ENBRE01_0013 [Enteropsectra breve]|nr:hypothetical protein ENBRE01_0013 [Enteropsectra breve]